MPKSKSSKKGHGTPLPASASSDAIENVVVGEGRKSKGHTSPKSTINKSGWKFKKYNRGSSGMSLPTRFPTVMSCCAVLPGCTPLRSGRTQAVPLFGVAVHLLSWCGLYPSLEWPYTSPMCESVRVWAIPLFGAVVHVPLNSFPFCHVMLRCTGCTVNSNSCVCTTL